MRSASQALHVGWAPSQRLRLTLQVQHPAAVLMVQCLLLRFHQGVIFWSVSRELPSSTQAMPELIGLDDETWCCH